MPEGSGEATVATSPQVAFRYLADPRHASEWFAGVELLEPPQGLLGTQTTWRFRQRSGQVVPLRMAEYEPPRRFAWHTRYWPLRSNLRWTMELLPAEDAPAQTLLQMTIRLDPGPLGWLTLLLTFGHSAQPLAYRAQDAAERARDALLELAAPERPKRPKQSQEKPRRRGRR